MSFIFKLVVYITFNRVKYRIFAYIKNRTRIRVSVRLLPLFSASVLAGFETPAPDYLPDPEQKSGFSFGLLPKTKPEDKRPGNMKQLQRS